MESITEIKSDYRSESQPTAVADAEIKRTLLAGVIGAVVAAGAYFIYTRLEDEQKDALRQTVGKFVEDKVAEIRSQLKF